MSTCPTSRIRNVVLVGQSGSGKTTLVEQLLLRSGEITRIGRVEDGTTVSDHEPEERERGVSLAMSLVPIPWQGHCINVLDTPGSPDFDAEMAAAMSVADLALIVVNAVNGVEPQTEVAWRMAADRGLPRVFFVNKEDKDNADFHRVMAELRSRFGSAVEELELPVGEESGFHGVADVLTERAYLYDAGRRAEAEVPAEMRDEAHHDHDQLIEDIVAGDDALLERFVDGDELTTSELTSTLAKEVLAQAAFPVLCGSAATGAGVDVLADYICAIGPSPLDRPARVIAGDGLVDVSADANGPALLFVYKTLADPYLGRLSLFKVVSGTLKADDRLVNSRTGSEERLHGLFTIRGKDHAAVTELVAGDLGGVAKLGSVTTGDTLAPKGMPVRFPGLATPAPVFAVAVRARTQADDDKLSGVLARLCEQDPALRVEQNAETHQTLVWGTGEAHLAVVLERMNRLFGVNVDLEEVKVAYRETIAGPASAEGKHKKQSGGHGQFGVAELEVSPLPRGGGFEFVDAVVGGAIPRQFIPAVQHGIEDAMRRGGPNGFPVVDVKVECVGGKYHAVDSSEMSFKMAGAVGFTEALTKAGTIVLEPISAVEIEVPVECQGDVVGDLNARRGRVHASESDGLRTQRIEATVPTSEILRYAVDLRSMTAGRGRFTFRHDHYDVLPPQQTAKLVASKAADNGKVTGKKG